MAIDWLNRTGLSGREFILAVLMFYAAAVVIWLIAILLRHIFKKSAVLNFIVEMKPAVILAACLFVAVIGSLVVASVQIIIIYGMRALPSFLLFYAIVGGTVYLLLRGKKNK